MSHPSEFFSFNDPNSVNIACIHTELRIIRFRNMELRISISHGLTLSSMNFFLILIAVLSPLEHVSAASYLGNKTDRLALLQFKHQISDDPNGVLNLWNDSIHHCRWQGVTCGARHQRVIAISIRRMKLYGSISPHLGNLSFLKSVELEENRFSGEIPQEIGRLFRLRILNLTANTLSGKIPVNLSRCLDLRAIDLNENSLEGKIPYELLSLKKLSALYLAVNNLTGEVPSFLGNLTSIKKLSLAYNNFEGKLPQEIGLLTNLSFLGVGSNKLTGTIPTSIFNSSLIDALSLSENFFYGKLPVDIGFKKPNLWFLSIGENQFTGFIPPSITNASRLEVLALGPNNIEGKVPTNLGHLPNLRWFGIKQNLLGSNLSGDLSFIASLSNCSNLQQLVIDGNNFGGELPISIANLSLQLRGLYMGGSNIQGKIPTGFGNHYINLNALGMEGNFFFGAIPSDFGEFQQLQALSLGGNHLSGKIPSTLCNITSLYSLSLDTNSFVGEISQSFENCPNLRILDISRNNLSGIIHPLLLSMHFSSLSLDLSYNSLSGSIPVEVGKLVQMIVFNLSYNKFSGEIPETLGDCSSLEYLHMQGNHFLGSIPPKLASLKGIQHLDLSQNNLTGTIPKDLQNLKILKYLNLSLNDLEGEIPIHGVFENESLVILVGNSKLCGGIPELGFPSCIIHKKKKTKLLVIIITSTVFGAILVLTLFSFYFIMYSKRQKRSESSNMPLELNTIPRISYHELHRATAGFSQENFIGSGSFGSVYRGILDQYANRVVAIKVLNLQKNGASKSFKTEYRTLRSIRHRNILDILTYCSSTDFKGNEFKAIIYKYMENGNLDTWLHQETVQQSRNLSFVQRFKIAVDVASALHYLHNQCGTVIVHCDLKPCNILLDNDLNAYVSDFGLAKLFQETLAASSEQETSSSVLLKGSIGYAAPEYGVGSEASPEGDVYSFGILLLEMFSGRRPTDDIFVEGLNLYNYVEINLLGNAKEIADPVLLSRERIGDVEKCIASLFKIGLKCSASSPNDRVHMNEVLRELQSIKAVVLGLQS